MPSVALDRLSDLTSITVFYRGRLVGTLARPSASGATYFQYSDEWLRDGFSISPLSLPLEQRVFRTDGSEPDQLFGVFSDSLPDDWGRLVMERRLEAEGIDSARVTEFSRLALVGKTGLGALEYEPGTALSSDGYSPDLDTLSLQCQEILDSGSADALDAIYRLGGSSGGARPKVMVDIDGEPWIVKFPSRLDGMDSGVREYRFALVASDCGIKMAEVRLLHSNICPGFFATKRFDRCRRVDGSLEKIHMASAAALLEASPFDVVDYCDLMLLSMRITGSVAHSEQLFRVMCFNVLAGNCDDHSRNFSFLYDEAAGEWHLAPAYDLTRDDGFLGEHTTLVNGKSRGIEDDDLVAVGLAGGLSVRRCRAIVKDITDVVSSHVVLDA